MESLEMKSWRRWHRWVAWIAAVFLLWASATGVIVAFTEFFGADETERERLRDVESAVKLEASDGAAASAFGAAIATALQKAPGAPIDKIEMRLKGDKPEVRIFLGKKGGGEDKMLRIDAKSGALIAEEAYVDKPIWWRLHSGEWFGDGGLVAAMLWGLALVVMSITGGVMYIHMYRRHQVAQAPTGLKKFFW
jgi:uncharacterized iron-regulated membrane protein